MKNRSLFSQIALIVAVLAVFTWSYFQEKKPRIETGTLEYRMVTGYRNGNLQLIVMEIPESFIVPDTTFRQAFSNSGGELVSRPLQVKLMESFENIEYRIGVKEESTGAKPAYRVSREVFNSVTFGSPVRYEVDKKNKDLVKGIVSSE